MNPKFGRGGVVALAAAILSVLLITLSAWTAASDHEEQIESENEALHRIADTETQNLTSYFGRARALTALMARNRTFVEHQRDHAVETEEAPMEPEVGSALRGMHDLTGGVGEACLTSGTGAVHACAVGHELTPQFELWPDYSWTSWFEPALELEFGEVHQTRPYVSNTNYLVIANATRVPLPAGAGEAIVHVETPIDAFRKEAKLVSSGFDIAVVETADESIIFDTTTGDDTGVEGSAEGEFLPDGALPRLGESYTVDGRLAILERVDAGPDNANDWLVVARAPNPAPALSDSIGPTQIGLFAGGLLLFGAAGAIVRFSRRAEEETARMKGDLLGLVSHELRTPLTSIIGYTELLTEMEADGLSEQGRGFVDVINRNAQRELRLVGDLLTLQQIDRGGFSINAEPQELTPIIEAALESARPKAEGKRIELRSDLEPGIAAAVDAERIGQVLDNLLSNAIKYTPDEGEVGVRLFSEGSMAVLDVTDTGLGIPADELDKLFERMYRASNATELHMPGVGLGLSIAKAIVDEHDGTISVSSLVDEGTTFRVELPIEPASGAGGTPRAGDGVATPA